MNDSVQNQKHGLDSLWYVLKDPEHLPARLQYIFERNELLAVKRKAVEAQKLAFEASETEIFSDAKSAMFAVQRLIKALVDIRPTDKEILLTIATMGVDEITDRHREKEDRGLCGYRRMQQLRQQLDRMLQEGRPE